MSNQRYIQNVAKSNYSFPVSDIKRTLDAMSWVKVSRKDDNTRNIWILTEKINLDKSISLAHSRLPELPSTSSRIHGDRTKRRIRRRVCVYTK